MLSDVPEYEEIDRLHFEEAKRIQEYQNECKDKGFDLFKLWFWNLWAGGLTCNGKTGSNSGHRAGELAANGKTRQKGKRVSGTAVSQPSFFMWK